jgi:diguanylate cyclase (GGDEF)-like protein
MERSGRDPDLDRLAEVVGRMIAVPIVLVSTIDNGLQRFPGAVGLAPALATSRATRAVHPYCQRVVDTGRPVIVHDSSRRTASERDILGAVSYAGFPLTVDGAVVPSGVLAAIDLAERRWLARDIAALRDVAALAGVLLNRRIASAGVGALEDAVMLERATRELWQRAATGMAATTSATDALRHGLAELVRHLGAEDADVVSVVRDQVHLQAGLGPDRRAVWSLAGDSLLIDAIAACGIAAGPTSSPQPPFGATAAIIVPIDGPRLGATFLRVFGSDTIGATSLRSVELCSRYAALLSLVLDRDTAEGTHDELTGLLNRRGFHAVAAGQLALARRRRLPGVVIFLDLDGLKVTNDRAGHAAGDELLRAAARALRATFRDSDTLGRLGGDELGVFSVAATLPDLAVIGERLDAEVAHINRDRDAALPLRWSTGAVAFDAESSANLDTLLAEADRRMYENKRRRVDAAAVP